MDNDKNKAKKKDNDKDDKDNKDNDNDDKDKDKRAQLWAPVRFPFVHRSISDLQSLQFEVQNTDICGQTNKDKHNDRHRDNKDESWASRGRH